MKNTIFLLSILFSAVLMVSCGEDNTSDSGENNTENQTEVKLKNHEEIDFNQWGFPLAMLIPDAENNGEPEVKLTNGGVLEVMVGKTFGVEIMYGEGDIALLKMDLEDDLVFVSEIISEEENLLIYKQDIPDSGVKTQHHFFYKAVINNEIFEIRDLRSETYSQKMIEDMIKAVKSLRHVPASSSSVAPDA